MTCTTFQMLGDAPSVREGLARALRQPPLSEMSAEARSEAELVLAEVLNNIAEHAYAAGCGPITLCLTAQPGRLCCRVEDQGAPMPDHRLPPGNPPPPLDLSEGGYGWHLIRQLTTGLRYERVGSVNQLSFVLMQRQ